MSLVNKILTAAMASEQHVFVNYSPHISGLHVCAHPADTKYQGEGNRVYLIDETIYLDWEGADEKLADVLAMIEELNNA
ncbi:hypothetical protein [uncultured Halomonas sp.]|uniref:hypothetical protein n=1 Tax=uncultured Halomonas sp. TaxID=173971 RepID=UPI002616C5AC|nr:hypothetical protein [uncultured Halomonas sp.]